MRADPYAHPHQISRPHSTKRHSAVCARGGPTSLPMTVKGGPMARRKVMGDPIGKTFYGFKAGLQGLSVTKPTAAGSARRVPTLR